MTTYECSVCGAKVTIQDGQAARTCLCAGTVIANLTATATGESKMGA